MSVLIETSEGDLVVDLDVDTSPISCTNFLKLCKVKYYTFAPFYNVLRDYTCQSGDPLYPAGHGGSSVWGLREPSRRTFSPDFNAKTNRHSKLGTVSFPFAVKSDNIRHSTSQFLITLGPNLHDLDDRSAVFGHVVEGFDTLDKINVALCDSDSRPLKDIRILHTHILEDPFDDPAGLDVPDATPEPSPAQLSTVRLGGDDSLNVDSREDQEARAQALTLEMVGDLPHADVKPRENVLFVCKLNPVTQAEDLEIIFSRFGAIVSCEVVRDKHTRESLQYAFIEFEDKAACERAYTKMQGVLVDDRRIHVDFSQSVARDGKYRERSDRLPERRQRGERRGRDDRRDRRSRDDRFDRRERSPYRS